MRPLLESPREPDWSPSPRYRSWHFWIGSLATSSLWSLESLDKTRQLHHLRSPRRANRSRRPKPRRRVGRLIRLPSRLFPWRNQARPRSRPTPRRGRRLSVTTFRLPRSKRSRQMRSSWSRRSRAGSSAPAGAIIPRVDVHRRRWLSGGRTSVSENDVASPRLREPVPRGRLTVVTSGGREHPPLPRQQPWGPARKAQIPVVGQAWEVSPKGRAGRRLPVTPVSRRSLIFPLTHQRPDRLSKKCQCRGRRSIDGRRSKSLGYPAWRDVSCRPRGRLDGARRARVTLGRMTSRRAREGCQTTSPARPVLIRQFWPADPPLAVGLPHPSLRSVG